MDSAMGVLVMVIILGVCAFGMGLLYKNRVTVAKWLNMPYFATDDRKLKLQRLLADTQAELKSMEDQEPKSKS